MGLEMRCSYSFKVSPPKICIYYKEREKKFMVKELSRFYLNQIIKIIPSLKGKIDIACPPNKMQWKEQSISSTIPAKPLMTWVVSRENIAHAPVEGHYAE